MQNTQNLTKTELFDKQSEALNKIAVIVSETPGLEYLINEENYDENVPKDADLSYAINSANEISVYREEYYDPN